MSTSVTASHHSAITVDDGNEIETNTATTAAMHQTLISFFSDMVESIGPDADVSSLSSAAVPMSSWTEGISL